MVRRSITIFCILACVATFTAAARAEPAPAPPPPPPSLSPDALRSFADDFVATTMAKYHVPGAACVIVKDGRVIHSRGYGYADAGRQIAVDPAQTRFAVGSLTKLFTLRLISIAFRLIRSIRPWG